MSMKHVDGRKFLLGMNIDTTDSIKAQKAQILGIVTVNASPQYV